MSWELVCDQCKEESDVDEAEANEWIEAHIHIRRFGTSNLKPKRLHFDTTNCLADYMAQLSNEARESVNVE